MRTAVLANVGVMLSAVLVLVTGSGYPDLVVGLAIGVYVIREAMEIRESAREARNEAQRD